MNDSKFREKIIIEYNKLKQVHPTYSEIAKIVGCSVATVRLFIGRYKSNLASTALKP